MLLAIGELTYELAEDEDQNRILDDVVIASRSGGGVVRFLTQAGSRIAAVVTPYIPVVVADPPHFPAPADSAEGIDEVGVAFIDVDRL